MTETAAPIKVIVVDDQVMIRDGIATLIGAAPDIEVVGQGSDGTEAIELARALRPDVVVMDIRMPGRDGISATAEIVGGTNGGTDAEATAVANGQGEGFGSKVLILTTFDLDEYVFDALAAGASGFLLKDAPAADLVAAIRVIAAGDALLAPSITKRLIADFAARRARTPGGNPTAAATLTARELDVLRQVARGLSNAEVAAELILGEQTVKTHVGRILLKLGLRDRAQIVVFAYENGLVES